MRSGRNRFRQQVFERTQHLVERFLCLPPAATAEAIPEGDLILVGRLRAMHDVLLRYGSARSPNAATIHHNSPTATPSSDVKLSRKGRRPRETRCAFGFGESCDSD